MLPAAAVSNIIKESTRVVIRPMIVPLHGCLKWHNRLLIPLTIICQGVYKRLYYPLFYYLTVGYSCSTVLLVLVGRTVSRDKQET